MSLVERKSGFAVLAKVPNKSADLEGWAIEAKLKSLNLRVKTSTVDNELNAMSLPITKAVDQRPWHPDLLC